MLLLLLIGLTTAYPCNNIAFEPCYFEYMRCIYKYSVYTDHHSEIYNLFEYKVTINNITIENSGIYNDNILQTFVYNSEYPKCKYINLINTTTIPCIICKETYVEIITNSNYGKILADSNKYLIIILSSSFGLCVVIAAIIIVAVRCKNRSSYKPIN